MGTGKSQRIYAATLKRFADGRFWAKVELDRATRKSGAIRAISTHVSLPQKINIYDVEVFLRPQTLPLQQQMQPMMPVPSEDSKARRIPEPSPQVTARSTWELASPCQITLA